MLPGLSNNEKRFFLGIAKGKITYKPAQGESETYDSFEGTLKSIVKREAIINGSPTLFYDFTMQNSGHTYVLSIPMGSGVARSIILSLASVADLRDKNVKISPYLKGEFTNVSVYVNGERTKWVVEKLPPVREINTGSKVVTDDSERVALVESYVNVINQKLARVFDEETGEIHDPVVETEDLPDELG